MPSMEKITVLYGLTPAWNSFPYLQATGGYSICVRDCYLTTNAVVFDTELIGPRKGEVTNASPSCPYIVIQVKNQDKSIIFE